MDNLNNPNNNKHTYNIDLNSLNATFKFDAQTGQIINQISAHKPEISEDEWAARLVSEAEQVINYPDAYMYFKVDEDDYLK